MVNKHLIPHVVRKKVTTRRDCPNQKYMPTGIFKVGLLFHAKTEISPSGANVPSEFSTTDQCQLRYQSPLSQRPGLLRLFIYVDVKAHVGNKSLGRLPAQP